MRRTSIRLVFALALFSPALFAVTAHGASWTGTWTNRLLTSGPGPKGWVDLIYDPVAARPVLFGGSGGSYTNDIWQMDFGGVRWVQVEPLVLNVLSPYGPPCPRDEHAVEYDSLNRLYWSFGGSGYACGYLPGTMAAGSTSLQIVDPALPATQVDYYVDWVASVPGPNSQHAFVSGYNPATKTLTLATPVTNDAPGAPYALYSQGGGGTWSYNPGTRAWLGFDAPGFGYTGAKPVTRLSPAFAYSPADQAAVMFGGVIYNDTWALDAQTRSWVQMLPDGAPGSPPRRRQITNSMAYDSVHDRFVLFGGVCTEDPSCGTVPYGGLMNDTWIYNLGANTWTQVFPPTSPQARAQHTLSFDPVNGVVVLFGGVTSAGPLSDAWVYDVAANTWSPVSASTVPPPRNLHAAVYDPTLHEHIIYGGNTVGAVTLGDVWSLKLSSGTSGSTVTLASSPNPSIVGASVTFTATVTGTNPTGTVSFTESGNALSGCASAPVSGSGNTRTAVCATSALSVGVHSIVANYSGDSGNVSSSSSPLSQVVNMVATTTTLTSSLNPSTFGTGVTFTATVAGSNPTGNVNFKDGSNSIAGCSAVALSGSGNSRTAQCTTAALSVATHSITAVYGGDAGNAGSGSTVLSQVVNSGGGSVNVALASNGGVASASSSASILFSPSSLINNERTGANWGSGGGWKDNTVSVFPDWVQINFSGSKTIDHVVVYTVQDNYTAPVEPTDTMTFSLYGVTDFTVDAWTGSSWTTLGTVSGNNLVKRTVNFAAFTTDRIRITINNALAASSRLVEVEAWGN